jgi:hypothetical protein
MTREETVEVSERLVPLGMSERQTLNVLQEALAQQEEQAVQNIRHRRGRTLCSSQSKQQRRSHACPWSGMGSPLGTDAGVLL